MKQLIHDEGLGQYDTVRAAYEKATKLITKLNNKELSDLLKVFDRNPEGTSWLRDELGMAFDDIYSYLEIYGRYIRSKDILKAIEQAKYRKADLGNAMIRTEQTAIMGLLHKMVTDDYFAQDLLDEINKHVPVTEGIYSEDEIRIEPNERNGYRRTYADKILERRFCANIFVRLLKKSLGDLCNAKVELKDFQTAFCLEKKPGEKEWRFPFTSALVAISSAVDNDIEYAKYIADSCEPALDRNKWMYNYTGSLYRNASMSILHKCIGNHKEAGWIIEGIEKNIKKEDGRFADGCEIWIPGNALMAIAYAMQDGAKLCGLPRNSK